MAERDLAKVEVVSSNLIARSTLTDRLLNSRFFCANGNTKDSER